MLRSIRLLVAAAALAFAATPGYADDRDNCAKLRGDDSIAACTKAITSGQHKGAALAPLFYNRGNAWYAKADHDRAIADYNETIRLDPKHSKAYGNRANSWRAKGDIDKALADGNQAIKLDPKNAISFYNRGLVWHDKNDLDRAMSDYNEAIKLNPKYVYAHVARGNIWHAKGDRDRAIADHSKAIEFDPNYFLAYNNRGNAWRAKGDNDRAIADYDEAIKHNPTYAIAYNNRGNAWRSKGQTDRAIADYDQALKINPRYAFAYNNRGLIFSDKGERDRAIADYSEAIKIDPSYTAAYTNRGIVHAAKGERDRAIADFNTALTLPAKYDNGKWAHDTARERIATLDRTPAGTGTAVATATQTGGSLTTHLGAKAVTAATPGRRVALVIGNGAYAAMPRLKNPVNDAADTAAALKAVGFEVTVGTDVKRNDMDEMLIRFAREARRADVALVYFAGHGIQHNGVNYLAPVDTRIEAESDLRRLVQVQSIVEDLKAASGARILILDACRDNGVVQQVASMMPATRSAAFNRGLSRVDKDSTRGVMVVFATQPSHVAKDGDGRNSPFTTALLKHLPTPGVELRTLMTRVRSDVVSGTGGDQWPEVSDSMVGEFVFKAGQ